MKKLPKTITAMRQMIKRTKFMIITISVIAMLVLPMSVSVAKSQIPGKIDVNLNGEYLDFDVDPIMQNDRVMLPMRKIFESLGASVDWNDETQTVTAVKDSTVVKLTVNSDLMTVNENVVSLDAPAVMVDNRTLVPVRAVSEALGASVAWFGYDCDIVTISTYPITTDRAIQAVRDIYNGYTWHDYTDAELDEMNISVYDIRYDSYSKHTVYDVVHNWDLEDEDGNALGGAHLIDVITGECVGGAG